MLETRDWRVGVLASILLGVGTLHFVMPRAFDAIMPRAVPEELHRGLTYASGVAELAAGALVAVPRTRRVGAALAFATFLGVYPANIDAALRGGTPGLPGWLGSAAVAWVRLPFQLPLLWWAWQLWRGDPADDRDDADA